MAPRAKQQEPIKLDVDTEWLRGYEEKMRAIGKEAVITEYAPEPVTDQADLSDIVEKQEEEAARLKKFADSPLPKTKDQIKQDKELNAALQRGKQQARNEQALHKRAQKMDAASDERVAKEKQRELDVQRKEAEREEEKKQARSIRDVRHVTRGINQALQQNVQPAIEKVGTLPTVGGIGLMVGILLVLLILIIPVNPQGDTRAKQFWYMLNGRAKLQGAVTPTAGSQPTGGTFGQNFDPTKTYPTPPDGSNFGGQPLPNTNGAFRTTPTNLGF